MRTKTGYCLLLAGAVLFAATDLQPTRAIANEDAARALAARFSGEPAPPAALPAATEEQRKAEEAEILNRARNEAEARAAEAQQEALAAEAAQKQAEAAARQLAEQQRKAIDEAAAAKLLAERQANTAAENAARLAQEAADIEARLARDREVANLSERLRRVRQSRPDGAMGLGAPMPETTPSAAAPEVPELTADQDTAAYPATADQRPSPLPMASVRNATSVTVLLVMEPGTNGIRRGSKTADPVICLDSWCYVSNGPGVPAKLMTRGQALGPINTLSLRAGACRQSLTCVYRGLDIAAYFKAGAKPALLQPVDLRYLHHDRRAPQPLSVSNACDAKYNQLSCTKTIKGKGWTAWIVPEDVAVAAGPATLQAALANGLGSIPQDKSRQAAVRLPAGEALGDR